MNHILRTTLIGARAAPGPSPLRETVHISFFHSTPVLERKRRTQCHSRFNYYAKRKRKFEAKRTLVRNLSEYAEYLFQSWRDGDDNNQSNKDSSWFRKPYGVRGTDRNDSNEPKGAKSYSKRKGTIEFCESDDDDDDIETIFQSSFGGVRFTYYSYGSSDNFDWKGFSGHTSRQSSRKWNYDTEDESEGSVESDLTSERIALGLSSSGPLKLEDVKNAYRTCALRWHPDRHQGSSKVVAEEKFKHCSAAYKTLCDRLALS